MIQSQAAPESLTQRSTDATLRGVLVAVAANPSRLAEVLAEYLEPLIAFTADRIVVAANVPCERIFGYDRRELEGRRTDELVPARLRQPDAPPIVVSDDLMSVDLPGLRRDGVEMPLAWTFGVAVISSGPVFIMTVRDRAVIDDALEALRVGEERFRLFLDSVRDHALIMLDESGLVSTWSTGAELTKQWTAAEIIGKPYELFFSPEERAHNVPRELLAAAVAKRGVEVSGWRVRKDGTRFQAESFLSPLWARDGRLRGYAIVTHDLTARLRAEETERRLVVERAARKAAEAAEERARVSEERVSRLHRMTVALSRATTLEEVAAATLKECLSEIEAAGGVLYLLTEDGATLALLDASGHPPESIDGFRRLSLDAHMPLCDAARSGEASFYDSYEACAAHYPALRGPLRGGDFEASAALPLMSRGTRLGVLGVRYKRVGGFDDAERSLLLTMSGLASQALERARLFAAEQHARALAENASRAKDDFLAMLGHELRNPLAPIATAVQVMKLRQDERSARERDVIERQVDHMTRLIDDLLDVSRIARGLIELTKKPIEIAEVLSQAVEMASPLLEQRQHRLTVDVPTAGLGVNADPTRLAQVFSNLLTNAGKYTPPRGNIHLSAALEDAHVVARVRDDGDGIGPDLLPRMFDMFVQGVRTFDRSAGGLGLGLALVKSLVTLHGGTVSVTSAGPKLGSELTVRIPAVTIDASPRVASPVAKPAPAPAGRRVLVVDDNEDAAEMLAEVLRMHGYEVELAHDGSIALARLRDFQAEVAILDLGLPVIDGFELARRITDDFADRRPRLVALTGYGQPHDRARTRAAGFEVHLTKPVDFQAVVDAVEGRGRRGEAPA